MHNRIIHVFFAFLISCLGQSVAYSQQPKDQPDSNDKWIRVQSDNGEFSIEVPAKYKFYYNRDGLSVAHNSEPNYILTHMRMLNAIDAGTLVSFETYETEKNKALDVMYNGEIYGKNLHKSKIGSGDHSIRQVSQKTEEFYWVRQYFRSKTHIYVLTAASRMNETPTMRRFLDSLVFKPNTKSPIENAIFLSKLPTSEIGVEMKLMAETDPPRDGKKSSNKGKDDTITPVAVFIKPRASYIDLARSNNVQGQILLKATMDADGFIPHIIVLKTLPDGLLRQALLALIRVKFMPKAIRGTPEKFIQTIEYGFNIY